MILRRRSLVLAALALAFLAPRAHAQASSDDTSWEEPTLEEALLAAKLVVRAHADPKATAEAPAIVVDSIVAGEGQPGATIAISNANNAVAAKYLALAPLKAPEEGFYILRDAPKNEDGSARPGMVLPSPTFGRFPIHGGKVTACVRDSFVRVDLDPADYAAFLKNAFEGAKGRKADAAWLDAQRATLAKLDPANDASIDAAHVALEGLAYGAEAKDAEAGLRFFASSKFQVRISAARLLERAGGERAAEGLLRLAVNDADPAVRSVATGAILRVKPRPKDAAKELLAHLPEASASSITLHQSVDDPRTNEYVSPLAAGFDALRELGAGADATPVAISLLAKDDGDTVSEACVHLAAVKPAPALGPIVDKMRPKDYQYTGLNEFIANALNHITGASVGPDKDAWRAWLEEHPEQK